MSELLNNIRNAQIRAGEDVVCKHLEALEFKMRGKAVMDEGHGETNYSRTVTPLRPTDETAEMALARIRTDAEDMGRKVTGHIIILFSDAMEMNLTWVTSAHGLALASVRLAQHANEILDEEAT